MALTCEPNEGRYGELATGQLKLTGIYPDSWELFAATVREVVKVGTEEQRRNHWIHGGREADSANSGLHSPAPYLSEMPAEEIVMQGSNFRSAASAAAFQEDLSWPTKALLLSHEKDGYLLPVVTFIQFPSDKHAHEIFCSFFMYACMQTCRHVWKDVPRINGWMFHFHKSSSLYNSSVSSYELHEHISVWDGDKMEEKLG